MPTAKWVIAWRDYSNERAKTSFRSVLLTGTNWAAEAAKRTALLNALILATPNRDTLLGQDIKETLIVRHQELSTGKPADPFAQRERKWRVEYQDTTTGDLHYFEIPCADSSLCQTNSDKADLTTLEWSNLKTAFDAVAVSRVTGNPVTLESAILVGRNT